MIELAAIETGKGALCRDLLQSLPEWFGIPEAIDDYASAVESLPVIAARADGAFIGFIAIKFHTDAAAEAYVLGVRREWHRRGVGKMLFNAAERLAAQRGVRFLTVKTIAASHPDPHYAAPVASMPPSVLRRLRFFRRSGTRPILVCSWLRRLRATRTPGPRFGNRRIVRNRERVPLDATTPAFTESPGPRLLDR